MAYSKSELLKVIDQDIVPAMQERLRAKVGFSATTRDVSSLARKGVDAINFPYADPRTAQAVSVGGSLSEAEITYKSDTLLLNQILGDAFQVQEHLNMESVIDIVSDNLTDSIESIRQKRDEKIYDALFAAASADASRKVVRTADIQDDIVELRKILVDSNVPVTGGNVYLACNSSDMAKILKLDNFMRFDATGDAEALRNGMVGKLFGMIVFEHNYAETVCYHSNGLVWANHGDLVLKQETKALNMGDLWSVSVKFGEQATKTEATDITPYIAYLADA